MDESEESKRSAAYSKVVAMAWSDPDFKAKLIANPKAALASMGVSLSGDRTFKVVENTPSTFYLVIPEQPQVELMDRQRGNCSCGCVSVRG